MEGTRGDRGLWRKIARRERFVTTPVKVLGSVVAAAALAGISAWISGLQRFTWGARFGVFGCALAVVVLGGLWQRCSEPRSSRVRGSLKEAGPPAPASLSHIDRWGLAAWLLVIVVAVIWDVLGLLTPANRAHLTLSALELAYRPFHAVLFALWLLIGWLLASTPLRRRQRQ